MAIVPAVGLCSMLAVSLLGNVLLHPFEALQPNAAYADELAAGIEDEALTVQGDTMATATAISLNKEQTGALSSSGDEDWYKVTLSKAGKFEIVFGGEYKTSGSWRIELYTAANKKVYGDTYSASNTVKHTVCTTGLSAGTYYIRVDNESGAQGLTYSLAPKFTESDAWEKELNDTIVSASPIANNVETHGNLQISSDEDWYKVTLPKAGKFEIVFGGDYSEDGSWIIKLYTAANKLVYSGSYSTSNTMKHVECTTGLPAGTYYIKIEEGAYYGYNAVGLTYSLTPKFTESTAWEAELNDTIVTATTARLGKESHGCLHDYSDEDWYRVTLPKSGLFGVCFSGGYSNDGKWNVELYSASNVKLSSARYAGSNTAPGIVCAESLDVGTYYIRVDEDLGSIGISGLAYNLTPAYIATVPEVATGLVYNGKEQVGVEAPEGVTLSGTAKAVDAGTYTATAKLDATHVWSDGTRDDKELTWSIAEAEDGSSSNRKFMYRLYNKWSGEHFYTSDAAERDNVVAEGWTFEGDGWVAPATSNTPVYRLYNKWGGEHHYTMDAAERVSLVKAGWKDEGIGWYSDDAKTVPLYRQYNPYAFSNNHNYTVSADERDKLVSLGWRDEGIAWYGV